VIKVFFLEDRPYKEKTSRYGVDLFMFDIKYEEKEKGKSIVSAEILKEITGLIKAGKRVIISGGLNIKNISKVIKISPYAVDVASGIEKLVGKKDEQTMKIFIGKAKASE
jgi:phosphoribosylanthranilate isomerase